MLPFSAQLRNPGWVRLGEAIAEFFELNIGELQIPASLDRAPTLLKLDGVCLREVRFRVALHMNDTKLNVGIGEETFRNRHQAAEVVVHDNHDAPQAAFKQAAQHEFPIFEIFTTWSDHARQDLLFAVAAQTNDNVDTSGTQLVAIPQFDIFAVQEQCQLIRMDRSAIA